MAIHDGVGGFDSSLVYDCVCVFSLVLVLVLALILKVCFIGVDGSSWLSCVFIVVYDEWCVWISFGCYVYTRHPLLFCFHFVGVDSSYAAVYIRRSFFLSNIIKKKKHWLSKI